MNRRTTKSNTPFSMFIKGASKELEREKTNMAMIMTKNIKVVPQRSCTREQVRTFSTVSGRPDS